jgi:hypothetical protein
MIEGCAIPTTKRNGGEVAQWRRTHYPLQMFRGLLFLLIGAAAAANASVGVIYAGHAWAAIDRGSNCEALSRSVRIAAKGKVQAIAGFTFSTDRRRWGEFHTRLRRMPRLGAAVMLRIDDRPFLLVSRENWAWSAGPLQEQAIIGALREAAGMSVESRDAGGRRFVDPYLLDGAATAIDAAAAACAGKMQPR